MDQENKEFLRNENAADTSEAIEKQPIETLIVPDDAFAQDVTDENITNTAEMLPQSLADDTVDFLDEDRELFFTDEEIAALRAKETSGEAKISVSEVSEETNEESDNSLPDDPNSFLSATENVAEETGAKKTRKIDSCFDILEMFVFALAFVLIAMAFFFRHSIVDGGSMDNTLHDKEHLIISNVFYSPKQGDIVVVQDTSKAGIHNTLSKPIVKRVIATEGQTVRIRSTGEVYVDGVLLNEEYIFISDPDFRYDELPSMTVPEGCVFLMGDHRDVSLDSRSAAGTFHEDAILGKVVLRIYPFDRFGTVR